jgi:hypothetical protein
MTNVNVNGAGRMKAMTNFDELYDEFESSMSANVIVQGPRQVLDLRKQLLKGCVQCGEKISKFMLPQDIACALTAGTFELKPGAHRLLSGLWNGTVSLPEAQTKTDSLIRAAGDTAEVLKQLKKSDQVKFLQVLVILWRYQKEKKRGETDSV